MKFLSFVVLACLAFAAPEPTYEMTTYAIGILRKGPAWTAADTAETRSLQAAHIANIQKMAATGKLIVDTSRLYMDDPRAGVNQFNDPGAYLPV